MSYRTKMRFSLRLFLIGAVVCGSVAGLYVRWYRSQPDYYVQDCRGIDDYRVNGSWLVDRAGRDKLVWLLITPDGNTSFSGGDRGTTRADYDQQICPWGIGRYSNALYEKGIKVPSSDKGRVWLYLTSKQKLAEIDTSRFTDTDLSLKGFEHLGETELWKQVLKPAADAESAIAAPEISAGRPKRQVGTAGPTKGRIADAAVER